MVGRRFRGLGLCLPGLLVGRLFGLLVGRLFGLLVGLLFGRDVNDIWR
jgi:hypothetical protein